MRSRWSIALRTAGLGAALATLACGGSSPTAPASGPPPGPPRDFALRCEPAGFGAGAGCANSACTVTSLGGFAGAVTLACASQPSGLTCGFGPNPVTLPAGATARAGFTVAADMTVPGRVHAFDVVATSGSLRRSASVTVETGTVVPPRPISSRSMLVVGCTGYVDGVLGAGTLQSFLSNFVGSRNDGFAGPQCAQTLAGPDGRFDLEIPRGCFGDDEPVYLTAGGLATCVTRRFAAGLVTHAVLLGRRAACP